MNADNNPMQNAAAVAEHLGADVMFEWSKEDERVCCSVVVALGNPNVAQILQILRGAVKEAGFQILKTSLANFLMRDPIGADHECVAFWILGPEAPEAVELEKDYKNYSLE